MGLSEREEGGCCETPSDKEVAPRRHCAPGHPVRCRGACDDDEPTIEEGTVAGDADSTIYDEEYGLYEPNEFDELDSAATLGRTVTVSANVKRLVEPEKAFITGAVNVDNDLLSSSPPKDAPSLSVGDDVLVVGKVIQFVRTDIEATYEPIDLDNDRDGDHDDAHAILAQTIIKPPRPGPGRSPAPPPLAAAGNDRVTVGRPPLPRPR